MANTSAQLLENWETSTASSEQFALRVFCSWLSLRGWAMEPGGKAALQWGHPMGTVCRVEPAPVGVEEAEKQGRSVKPLTFSWFKGVSRQKGGE